MKFLTKFREKRKQEEETILYVLVDVHTHEQVLAFKNHYSAGVAQNMGWRDNVQQTQKVPMARKLVNCEMAPETFFGG